MIPEEVRKAALEAYKRGIKPAEICNVMKISYTSLCRFRTQERNEGNLKQRPRTRSDASLEKDKQITSKELRLIRKLLRADDSQQREKILEDAFTPRENLLVRACHHTYLLRNKFDTYTEYS